jgi:uncharacterized protein YceH (UPF0502 family)
LLNGPVDAAAVENTASRAESAGGPGLAALQAEVAALREEVAELRAVVEGLKVKSER